MTQKFIVSVPGRAHPLCIEADSFDRDGWNDAGFTFRRGADVVAQLPAVDLVAKADSLPAFPELEQFQSAPVCAEPGYVYGPGGTILEPGGALDPLPAKACMGFSSWGGPAFWPFLSGGALGFIGGFGIALSHAGVW